jgi:hypothetical protein
MVHEAWALLQLLKDIAIVAAATGADTPAILRDHQMAWGAAMLRQAIGDLDCHSPSKNAWVKSARRCGDNLADRRNPFDAEAEAELHIATKWAFDLGARVKGERRDISSLRKKLRESLDRWQKSITAVGTAYDRDKRIQAIHFVGGKPAIASKREGFKLIDLDLGK